MGRKIMNVGDTKNGAVLVITKEQCQKLGFKLETPTSEVIKFARGKLGLI